MQSTANYPRYVNAKPNMGKACIRFEKPNAIPYEQISKLAAKISVQQWIETYEKTI